MMLNDDDDEMVNVMIDDDVDDYKIDDYDGNDW